MANREFTEQELSVQAAFCEEQIMQIVTALHNERNQLREEVKVWREKAGAPVACTSQENESAQLQSVSDFKKLLKELMPIRLSDEELLKLASMSKVRTEIEQRQTDNGKFKFL